MSIHIDEETRAAIREAAKQIKLNTMETWAKALNFWNFEQTDAWGYYGGLINPYEREDIKNTRDAIRGRFAERIISSVATLKDGVFSEDFLKAADERGLLVKDGHLPFVLKYSRRTGPMK